MDSTEEGCSLCMWFCFGREVDGIDVGIDEACDDTDGERDDLRSEINLGKLSAERLVSFCNLA